MLFAVPIRTAESSIWPPFPTCVSRTLRFARARKPSQAIPYASSVEVRILTRSSVRPTMNNPSDGVCPSWRPTLHPCSVEPWRNEAGLCAALPELLPVPGAHPNRCPREILGFGSDPLTIALSSQPSYTAWDPVCSPSRVAHRGASDSCRLSACLSELRYRQWTATRHLTLIGRQSQCALQTTPHHSPHLASTGLSFP